MKHWFRLVLALFFTTVVTGCAFERHYAIKPGENQVIQVASGDRWYFELEENGTTGYEWIYDCDDPDVEVRISHQSSLSGSICGAPGVAKVSIRIHRGYDGPSTVTFSYCRRWEKKAAKSFTISLYRRTGDEAFWK